MKAVKTGKQLTVKVRVTVDEKKEILERADAVGLSMSGYLSTVGLARQTGVSAERQRDHVYLLEAVLAGLLTLSRKLPTGHLGNADTLLALQKLSDIENLLLLLGPSRNAERTPKC